MKSALREVSGEHAETTLEGKRAALSAEIQAEVEARLRCQSSTPRLKSELQG